MHVTKDLEKHVADPEGSRIRIIFKDPDPGSVPGCLGSGSISYLMSTKITGRENLTKYAFWLSPVGPTGKENQVKM